MSQNEERRSGKEVLIYCIIIVVVLYSAWFFGIHAYDKGNEPVSKEWSGEMFLSVSSYTDEDGSKIHYGVTTIPTDDGYEDITGMGLGQEKWISTKEFYLSVHKLSDENNKLIYKNRNLNLFVVDHNKDFATKRFFTSDGPEDGSYVYRNINLCIKGESGKAFNSKPATYLREKHKPWRGQKLDEFHITCFVPCDEL